MSSRTAISLRFAAGLLTSTSREHRWRQISGFVASLLATLMILAGLAVAGMLQHQMVRAESRLATLAESAHPDSIYLLTSFDTYRGHDIAVAWIEPVDPGGHPVLLPGLTRMPRPGQSAVSPALMKLIQSSEELRRRYPDPLLLGWPGVASGSELLAVTRPRAGELARAGQSPYMARHGARVGAGPVAVVSGFGAPPGPTTTFYGDTPDLPVGFLAAGLAILLGVPAVMVLTTGLSAASPMLDQRFRILSALGARRSSLRQLAAFEGVLLCLPGALIGGVLGEIVGHALREVPLVDTMVAPGDLMPSPLVAAAAVSGVLLVAAAISAVRVSRRSERLRRRPTHRPIVRWWMSIPVGLAALAFAGAAAIGGRYDADLRLLGCGLVVIGVATITPALVRLIGLILAVSRRGPVFLAGRIIAWRSEWVSKAFIGLASLMVIGLGSVGYIAVINYVEPESQHKDGPVTAAAVESLAPVGSDLLSRIRSGQPGDVVVPVAEEEDLSGSGSSGETGTGSAPPIGSTMRLASTCQELAAVFVSASCSVEHPLDLPEATRAELIRAVERFGESGPVTEVQLVPSDSSSDSHDILVLSRRSADDLDRTIRLTLAGTHSVMQASTSADDRKRLSPLNAWIRAGTSVAVVSLGIAGLMVVIDRLLTIRRDHRQLLNIGVTSGALARILGWLFAAPYGAVMAVAFAAGYFVASVMVSDLTPVPWAPVAVTIVTTLLLGLAGTVASALLGSRAALRELD